MTSVETSTESASGQQTLKMPPSPNWQDQDDQLREMWMRNQPPAVIANYLGRSVAAIMTRAVRLGLPRRAAPGRKPGYKRMDTGKPATAIIRTRPADSARNTAETLGGEVVSRICLMCLNKFPSQGRHNRICASCKSSAEYAAGSSIPDINFKVET